MTDLEWRDWYMIAFAAVAVFWYVFGKEQLTAALVVGIVGAIFLVDGYRILAAFDTDSRESSDRP